MLAPASGTPDLEPCSTAEIRAEDHLPLVRKVAMRLVRRLPPMVDVNDLIGAGTLGLIDAVEKYDPLRCDRFGAYAEIRIRGAMLDELRAMDWVPRSIRHKGHRLEAARAALSQAHGRAPEAAEMAAHLGMTSKAYEEMQHDVASTAVVNVEDLDALVGLDEVECAPHAELDRQQMRERLARALTTLPERERQVLSLYYVEELKLKEIGEIFGVTESRICQLHAQAVSRLQRVIAAEETA